MRRALLRAGTAALLTAGGLAVAAPAHAVDQADLDLTPSSFVLAKGVKEARAKPFKFTVRNLGPADATDVEVTVDVTGLTRKVGHLLPPDCAEAAGVYTCALDSLAGGPDVPAGTSEEFGIPLYSTGGTGDGGVLKVTVSSATGDPDDENNVVELDIPVVRASYDLSTWTQDIHADVVVDGDDAGERDLDPVPPGATEELDWLVYNGGRRRAVGLFFTVGLPAGATVAELPDGCEKRDAGGLDVYDCTVPEVVLRPGQFYTDTIRVRVDASVTAAVLTPGVVTAYGMNDVADEEEAEEPRAGVRTATAAQRRMFQELDEFDNTSIYDIFVDRVAAPTPTATPSTGPTAGPTAGPGDGGSGGGDGGLPVTGVQAGLIGGIGLAVVVAGGVLFLLVRRRRIVLVSPDDERPGAGSSR
ncbi:MAG TPA: cell wall anchor protein [Micromonospora sp.]